MIKKKYQIEGMHCTACVLLIESELEDLGIIAKCDFVNETLEVEFDPKQIDEGEIKKTVNSTGYTLS